MTNVDPWEKAAECARAIQAATDPQHRTVLTNLRDLWIALANESDFMTVDQIAREAEAIARLHVELAAVDDRVLH